MPRGNENTVRVDKLVGRRVHELRVFRGLSRQQLAAQIGVTHQQLQKYEQGSNRISAGRLSDLAHFLKESISYFFEEGDYELPTQHQRMCLEVSRNFMKIENPEHQNAVNKLVASLASK